ncbi:MAG TPA: CidA/LrgA family protein [Acetobacteraceae bacterium]|jgi:holin-like protein|nr:CidA/LrgA family protein [Acetobacteraceae bacterium]
MPTAFLILVGCELIGEVLRRVFHLPLPGPVIGMSLLALALTVGGDGQAPGVTDQYSHLTRTANALITNMGLLFVPAGVGVIAEFGVLRQNWLPILVGLLASTVLGLVVTGLVMHRLCRAGKRSRPAPELLATYQEKRG